MKKYLGAPIDIYSVIICLFFIIIFISFPILISLLFKEISLLIISFTISIVGLITFIIILIKCCDQFFSWGLFNDSGIIVKNIFKGRRIIEYNNIVEIGVACFAGNKDYGTHIGAGFIYTYIYFSTFKHLSSRDRININKIKQTIDPPEQIIKLHFTEKNYKYLIGILPSKLAKSLETSYHNHLNLIRNNTASKIK